MTPMLQTGFGALLLALSYLVILAGSTLAFVIVETKCDIACRKRLKENSQMGSKAQMIFDEIGTDVSGPVREAILSIDKLEKEVSELKAGTPVEPAPEPKPAWQPPKQEVTIDGEDNGSD